jgi:hypothetical protein
VAFRLLTAKHLAASFRMEDWVMQLRDRSGKASETRGVAVLDPTRENFQ